MTMWIFELGAVRETIKAFADTIARMRVEITDKCNQRCKKILTCHIAGMELINPIEIRGNEPVEWAMARRIAELEEEIKSSCPASEVKKLESNLEEARKETTRIGIKNGELWARIIKLEAKF